MDGVHRGGVPRVSGHALASFGRSKPVPGKGLEHGLVFLGQRCLAALVLVRNQGRQEMPRLWRQQDPVSPITAGQEQILPRGFTQDGPFVRGGGAQPRPGFLDREVRQSRHQLQRVRQHVHDPRRCYGGIKAPRFDGCSDDDSSVGLGNDVGIPPEKDPFQDRWTVLGHPQRQGLSLVGFQRHWQEVSHPGSVCHQNGLCRDVPRALGPDPDSLARSFL
mmetsp:Transcript_23042/g.48279  ORF Transcript_23042/g.48279 Transcript_23042/m.48279 type:complete len:219 (+) Transcript_23042:1324-1980(+)